MTLTKITTATAIVLALSMVAFAGGVIPPTPPPQPPQANEPQSTGGWADKLFLAMGPMKHDFGGVPRGPKFVHRFQFKNIYSVPIAIDCRASMGASHISRCSYKVGPGELGFVEITV